LVPHPAVLDLPHALVEWLTMLIVTARVTVAASFRRTGVPWSRWCTCASTSRWPRSPQPSGCRSAPPTLTSTGPSISSAARAPGLLKVLRENTPDFVLLDGTLAECDRTGNGTTDYSAKHRRHGVNGQVVTDHTGEILWFSPALPGRAHDLTTARTHKIVRICERQGVPILADRAYQGAGPWVTTGIKRPPGGELTATQRSLNRGRLRVIS
jgi:hypothetical protein